MLYLPIIQIQKALERPSSFLQGGGRQVKVVKTIIAIEKKETEIEEKKKGRESKKERLECGSESKRERERDD